MRVHELQIASLSWELRETPGDQVTPKPPLALLFSWSWLRPSTRWWRMVRNVMKGGGCCNISKRKNKNLNQSKWTVKA